jgi:hypothetical protein
MPILKLEKQNFSKNAFFTVLSPAARVEILSEIGFSRIQDLTSKYEIKEVEFSP